MTNNLEEIIAQYIDFPKKGIVFKDTLTLLRYPEVFQKLIVDMSGSEIFKNADAIISIDARGFIFGTAISMHISKPMICARKPGKLPGELLTKTYDLEYGSNTLSIQKDSIKEFKSFVIVDDLLATGGTVLCVADMLLKENKKILGLSVVIELTKLKARNKLPFPVKAQLTL